MRTLLVAFFLLFLIESANGAAADAAPGKAAWDAKTCRLCHGQQGEGGYGPDLAGRALSIEQFQRAVRKPWGVMPAFNERQISDQTLADIRDYFATLPRVAEPGPWRLPPPPPDAPRGQFLLITNGCGQCHQAELRDPRMELGGEAADVDYAFFAKRVYEHSEAFPDGRMGDFSKMRLPESVLQEIFRFSVQELGLLPPIAAEIQPGVPAGANTTYTLTMKNGGKQGKGLTAEDVTIALALPQGASVVSGTGAGYQGTQKDPQSHSDVAIWKVPRVAPGEEQSYTLTLSGKTGAAAEVFKGSVVRWSKPEMRKGAPNLALRDSRMPGKDPQTPVTFPTPQQKPS